MTLHPVLPGWIMLPLIAAVVLFLGGQITRARRRDAARDPGAVRDWLFRGILVLLVLGAALRPGIPGGSTDAATADVNVFFVVDTTSSIAAEDYGDSLPRLQGVRQDVRAIAAELAGARFSLITFDTNAAVRMPLTTDTSALDTLVTVLEPQVAAYSKGSSVTVAAKLLGERLRAARENNPERPRVVFYFGDGEQTSGKAPAPMRVDTGLVSGGAVLGYGTAGGGRMKENTGPGPDHGAGYIPDRRGGTGQDALSVMDEGQLRQIAGDLGVPYVHRSAGDATAPMLQEANPGTLRRGEGDGNFEGRMELYWILAAGAFVLALRETVLVLRQLRELRPPVQSAPVDQARTSTRPRPAKPSPPGRDRRPAQGALK
ncbi:vWA domain-containing protein [Arthrobacter sp. B6]|uniref:vWA domain-containing protein n=1 Tax=Arthrobacter sp. B6 TaxID=1570137 RepID=UPI000836FEC9|nr:VWA domain-containing protein [Arthrobacter sp. B6]